jgi:trigger factor
LKIDKQYLDNHQIKLTVEADPESIETAKQRAARQLAKKYKIPGFRPGKAPYKFVERYLGEAAIMEAALEPLVEALYPKAIEEAGIDPYGPSNLDGIPSKDPLTFEFTIPLRAEVTLADYHTIDLAYTPPEVAEGEVDKVLQNLREQRAKTEKVDRPVQVGDQTYAKLSATRLNPSEGQSPTLLAERRQLITIDDPGTDVKDEWPFPGFSNLLIGMSANSEITHTHTFPEDSAYDSLRGVSAEFHAVIDEVRQRTLPELDDEFAKSLGQYENLEALRKDIFDELKNRATKAYHEDYDEKIMAELLKSAQIKFPPQMLEDEVTNFKGLLEQRLAQQNLDLTTYIKMRGLDEESFTEQELRPGAKDRLERSLVLFQVARQENIKPEIAAIEAETTRTLSALAQVMDTRQKRKLNDKRFVSHLANDIAADMVSQQTWERLRAIAKGEVTISLDTTTPAVDAAVSEGKAAPKAETTPTAAKPKRRKKVAEPAPTETQTDAA